MGYLSIVSVMTESVTAFLPVTCFVSRMIPLPFNNNIISNLYKWWKSTVCIYIYKVDSPSKYIAWIGMVYGVSDKGALSSGRSLGKGMVCFSVYDHMWYFYPYPQPVRNVKRIITQWKSISSVIRSKKFTSFL